MRTGTLLSVIAAGLLGCALSPQLYAEEVDREADTSADQAMNQATNRAANRAANRAKNRATTRAGLQYEPVGTGIRWLVKSDAFLKTLVERENYGNADVEIAELYLPKTRKSEHVVQGLEHKHRSTEIFYVISGRLGHTVNGKKYVIEPGQVGIVHGGEKIIHSVEGDEPVKAIVIWVPGGEAANMIENLTFEEQPIGRLLGG